MNRRGFLKAFLALSVAVKSGLSLAAPQKRIKQGDQFSVLYKLNPRETFLLPNEEESYREAGRSAAVRLKEVLSAYGVKSPIPVDVVCIPPGVKDASDPPGGYGYIGVTTKPFSEFASEDIERNIQEIISSHLTALAEADCGEPTFIATDAFCVQWYFTGA